MTTEIAVLNQQAVALAADSAVSSSSKVFQSANKIFSLSKIHPIGIMIYSASHFMGTPLEAIIKIYRDDLGKTEYASVQEYACDFLNFIKSDKKLQLSYYSDNRLVESNVFSYSSHIVGAIKKELEGKAKETGKIVESEGRLIAKTIAERYFSSVSTAKELEIKKTFLLSSFIDRFQNNLDRVFNIFFEQFRFGKEFKNKFYAATYDVCTRLVPGVPYSGIVFAGYGGNDIFPAIESYRVGGIINQDIHKYKDEESASLSQEHPAQVVGFAQQDMIQTFMGGVHPRYMEISGQAYEAAMKGLVDPLIQAFKVDSDKQDKIKAQLEKTMDSLLTNMYEHLRDAQYREFIHPIMETICMLSPSEIANLAEAMVNLTTLQRQFSNGMATVGGPTDVALISKGDGFVWARRKHYFPAELNHQFFRNYFRRCENEKIEDVTQNYDLQRL